MSKWDEISVVPLSQTEVDKVLFCTDNSYQACMEIFYWLVVFTITHLSGYAWLQNVSVNTGISNPDLKMQNVEFMYSTFEKIKNSALIF